MRFVVTEDHPPYREGQVVSPRDENLYLWRGRAWARPYRGEGAETATSGPDENAALEPLEGGWYRLPDGRKVQGRGAALEALDNDGGDDVSE